jgi:hypothetical protein
VRRIFAAALLSFCATNAFAETLQSQLSRCVVMTGLLQRLACYDEVVKGAGIVARPVPAPVPAAPPASVASVVPAPSVPSAPASFGSESLPRAAIAAPRRQATMTATVTQLTFDGTGRFTVALDNGQVWRQMSGDTAFLRQSRLDTVRLSRGALGSYDLTVPGLHATYRVTRIQ